MLGALLHYLTIAGTIGFCATGVGIGLSLIARGTVRALFIQPSAHQEITKVSILAMALTETGGVIGLTVALMMILTTQSLDNSILYPGIARFGIFFAIGIISFVVGIVSSKPAEKALLSVARQPFFTTQIVNIMLITLSIIQTPVIFGFIIAFMINAQAMNVSSYEHAFTLLAAGICLGMGSIGPAIGQSMYAGQACASVGVNRQAYRGILTFSLISQAMIESPIVFALLVSLIIIAGASSEMTVMRSLIAVAAGLCVGITNVAPGISSGQTAASAGKQITEHMGSYTVLMRTSLIAQGLIDTFAIYGLLIALILLLFVK